MKKIFIAMLVLLIGVFGFFAVDGANAAPAEVTGTGPFDGTFNGTVYAPDGSSAPMSLVMNHQGNAVDGTVFIGEGLHIKAGACGAANIPAYATYAAGSTSASNPNVLAAKTSFSVSGVDVTVNLNSRVSGDTLNAEAKIDLPFFCGGDQILSGTFHRA